MKTLIAVSLLAVLGLGSFASADAPNGEYRDSISAGTFKDGETLSFTVNRLGNFMATFSHEADGSIRLNDLWRLRRSTEASDWYYLDGLSDEAARMICKQIGLRRVLGIDAAQTSDAEFQAVNEDAFLFETKSRVVALRCGK